MKRVKNQLMHLNEPKTLLVNRWIACMQTGEHCIVPGHHIKWTPDTESTVPEMDPPPPPSFIGGQKKLLRSILGG